MDKVKKDDYVRQSLSPTIFTAHKFELFDVSFDKD